MMHGPDGEEGVMIDMMELSPAMQDYLEAILVLSEKLETVRVTDIAEQLDIAKASVSQAISSLKELSLVQQDRYGPVTLTPAGKRLAQKVRHRHRILRRFLVEVLGVKPAVAEKDACLMEHVISPQTMEKLVEFLEKTAQENPVEAAEKLTYLQQEGPPMLNSAKIRQLAELKVGESGIVIRNAAQGSLRRRLLEMGITSGAELTVKGAAPLGDPMEISVKGYSLSLRKNEAAEIFVEVL
jgi:DtxR family Mn-dependent transcriptional regulator